MFDVDVAYLLNWITPWMYASAIWFHSGLIMNFPHYLNLFVKNYLIYEIFSI